MKNKFILSLTLGLLFLQACQPPAQDLAGKKAELEKLLTQRTEIETQIATLESEIALLDTTAKVMKQTPVKVDSLLPETFRHFVKLQGKIESEGNVMVSPKMAGIVTQVFVKEGDIVSQGKLLATLDAAMVQSALDELQTSLDLANIAFDKQKRLWDQKIGTEMQYLQAKNQKEALEGRMRTTREQLEMTKIYAPLSGNVDKVMLKTGEAAMPGMPAFQIVNQSDIHFSSELSESYVGKIHKGDEVDIFIPTLNDKLKSRITVVGQSIHPVNRTLAIEASLPRNIADLKPNMSGEIVINDKTIEKAITVPLNLLQNTELGTFVFTARQDESGNWVAHKSKIETGMSYEGKIVASAGLKPGDLLITVGYQDLSEGQLLSF
ncbi:MAG: efflux RND transporter periplasmic adaptor subunit [Bacteroidia bacterium]|nr:efflux RND transporter periplasmic adaptor subunit [Bacteroidia bacterium]